MKIHFVGIGGIGMSALARFWLQEGAEVSGSDSVQSHITDALEAEGATISYEQNGDLVIYGKTDLVVYTEAMSHDHPELVKAREGHIETINYFEALGRVTNDYYLIAVAGTHGKTTTTAMLADVLEAAGMDPTVIVGSLRSKTGSNFRAGKSKYAIVEACEYKRDFLHLRPDVLVITNLEFEHVDYYKDLADVQSAFRALALKVPETGAVVVNTADPNITPVVTGLTAQVLDYRNDISFTLPLTQPGLHNRQNAAAALSAARFVGVEQAVAEAALSTFVGTWRRFEYKGEVAGSVVYDDYAHHPTEIKAAIAGAREVYPERTVTVVFQPHTYSRTKELFTDFITALSAANKVVLLPIYAAREVDDGSITSDMLAVALAEKGVVALAVPGIAEAATVVRAQLTRNEVVLCIGAGSVTKVTEQLTA